MASLFLSFFFLVAIGLASRNKERAGGDRRGEADVLRWNARMLPLAAWNWPVLGFHVL